MEQGTQTQATIPVILRRRQYEITFSVLGVFFLTVWVLSGGKLPRFGVSDKM